MPRPPLSAIAASALALAITCALCWPLPLHLDEHHLPGSFHDGHIWCFDHIHRMLTGAEPLSAQTSRIGFPGPVEIRFIAWVPAIGAAVLRALTGPLGAYNAIVLLSPALAAAAAWWCLRQITRAGGWAAAGGALVYALSPYALGLLASGQTAKLQHWILPLWLGLLVRALDGAPRAKIQIFAVTLAAAFTAPSYALYLPILGGAWVAAAGLRGLRAGDRAPGLRGVAALGVTAAGVLPAWLYYGGDPALVDAFLPASPPPEGLILSPPQIAEPRAILLGPPIEPKTGRTYHVPYLGLPALGIAALLSFTRAPSRAAGWGLVALGAALSLGPALAESGRFVQIGGHYLPMPAAILEWTRYPTSRSGMYYRAIAIASLGLAVLFAGGAAQIRARLADLWGRPGAALSAALALALGLGVVADGIRATAPLWPLPSQPVPGAASLQAMADDPTPGAVLNVPMWVGDHEGGTYLLLSLLHERPTSGLPRDVLRLDQSRELHQLLLNVKDARDPARGHAMLYEAGFRYVVYTPWFPYPRRNVPYGKLIEGLGMPQREGDLFWWTVEPPEGKGGL